jgi:hypothetical protein
LSNNTFGIGWNKFIRRKVNNLCDSFPATWSSNELNEVVTAVAHQINCTHIISNGYFKIQQSATTFDMMRQEARHNGIFSYV